MTTDPDELPGELLVPGAILLGLFGIVALALMYPFYFAVVAISLVVGAAVVSAVLGAVGIGGSLRNH